MKPPVTRVSAVIAVVIAVAAAGLVYSASRGADSQEPVATPALTVETVETSSTTTTTVSPPSTTADIPAYLSSDTASNDVATLVNTDEGSGPSGKPSADNQHPWLLPPLVERQAAEAARQAAAAEAAAAAATTTTIPAAPATTVASATTTTSPSTSVAPVNNTAVFPGRGGVGFLGDPASLTIVDRVGTEPAGTTWDDARKVLNVQSPDTTLDHLLILGGVDVYGGGTTTITNSIIEFGAGDEMGVLMRGSAGALVMTDTTIRRKPGTSPTVGTGRGVVQVSGGHPMTLLRNDLSGLPDGMQLAGDGLLVAWNWIHDLAMVGSYPNNTHNDGVQLYSGSNITFSNNRIEIGAVAPYSNGALFFQGSGIGTVRIESNYLDGGGFPIRLETGTVSVVNNVVGPNHLYGNKFVGDLATVVEWRDNLDLSTGGAVTPP